MRKTVKTGRGTGKTYETVQLMLDNPNLFTIVSNRQLYRNILNMFVKDYPKNKVSEDKMNELLNRVIEPEDIQRIKYHFKNAKFHIEEADQLLSELLGVQFDTMTTSHWHVETFKRNEYEKEGL